MVYCTGVRAMRGGGGVVWIEYRMPFTTRGRGHLRGDKTVDVLETNANSVVALSPLALPSADYVRSARLRLLREAEAQSNAGVRVSSRYLERLRREPIVRKPVDRKRGVYSDYDLSRIALFDGNFQASKQHPFLAPSEASSRTALTLRERLAWRVVVAQSGLPEGIGCAILNQLREGSPALSNFRDFLSSVRTRPERMNAVLSGEIEDSGVKFRLTSTIFSLAFVLEQHLGWSSDSAFEFAQRLFDRLYAELHDRESRPILFKREPEWTTFRIEPAFEDFFSSLREETDLTGFFENQALVRRPKKFVVPAKCDFDVLRSYSYDPTRVREFSLYDNTGAKLEVVSKRLGPMKSDSAEAEYDYSVLAYRNGIPTPRPVGVIHDRGNTYFLWQKIKSLDKIPSAAATAITLQKDEILARLAALGIELPDHREKDRNFLIAREDGQIKVYVLDFERVRRRPRS